MVLNFFVFFLFFVVVVFSRMGVIFKETAHGFHLSFSELNSIESTESIEFVETYF